MTTTAFHTNSSSTDDITPASRRGNAAFGSASDTDSKANRYQTTGSLNATAVLPSAMTQEEAKRKKFGEDIAFGVQQTFACWATDFIDPYVGEKIQDKFGADKRPTGSTWIGEITGDTAAFFTFLGLQKFVPGVSQALSRVARKLFNRQLERTGKKELKEWAQENNIRSDSPQYEEKMEEWKNFQADNIAKSSIVSVSSIALNVGTQKAIGNKHSIWVITLAKLAGASITVAGLLGLRFALPRTARTLDEEASRRYFAPLIRKTQKLFGAEEDEKQPEKKHSHRHHRHERSSHVSAVEESRSTEVSGQPAR